MLDGDEYVRETLGVNILDAPVSNDIDSIFTPFKLVSLLDMLIRLHIDDYHTLVTTLILFGNKIKAKDTERGDKGYTEDERRVFTAQLQRIDAFCRKVQINTGQSLYRVIGKIHNPHFSEYPAHVYWVALAERILDELRERTFMFIPKPQNDYYDNDALFGKEVCDGFPSAQGDLKEAGNCYATGSYTACVFHLMRVVEVGAKVMVRAMGAQKYLGEYVWKGGVKTFKKRPVELCDWKTLRDGLNNALKDLEKGSSTSPKKKQSLAYYSHAIAQFSNFKDAWRNMISHGHEIERNRKLYFEGEAKDIMNNTHHFMQHLAKRLKEKR